ncbi:Peptidyl-prolyl cis-trans isomerase NIMA-interacting protein 1, partial [Coemansia sp. RSA 1933]
AIENKEVDFGDIALEESDCSSAKRKGDLGWFEKGRMQPAFEDAVRALQVGELSQEVKSDSGIHIILRTG